MNNTEYYKSLISDDEVIKALIKESKEREEGELLKEKTRVRPNLNFFQRTVTNLVSSNKRIATKQENFVLKKQAKCVRKIKTPHTLMKEILIANKVDSLKSNEEDSKDLKENLESYIDKKRNMIRKLKQKQTDFRFKTVEKSQSINFNIRSDKRKFSDDASTSVNLDSSLDGKRTRRCSDSSEISIVSISSSESDSSEDSSDISTIIKLSDSDSDYSDRKETGTNGKNVCEHKRKLKKKRER